MTPLTVLPPPAGAEGLTSSSTRWTSLQCSDCEINLARKLCITGCVYRTPSLRRPILPDDRQPRTRRE